MIKYLTHAQFFKKYLQQGPRFLSGTSKKFLQIIQENKGSLRIQNIQEINHNTKIFRFGFDDINMELGMNVGEHLILKKNEIIKRKYTPISQPSQKGYCDILIKIYRPNLQFPEGGKLTQWIDTLKKNDIIGVEGPVGFFNYLGHGQMLLKKQNKIKKFKQIMMIAGGSGITPMFQIIQSIALNNDKTQVKLLYGNQSEKDILLYEQLKEFENIPNIKIFYAVDQPSQTWTGLSGQINEKMIENCFDKGSDDILAVTCGPKPMNLLALETFVKMGYDIDSNIYKF